jgi:glycerate 2-kinase
LDQAAAKAVLDHLFRAGVEAAAPSRVLPAALATLDAPPTLLMAAGKAGVEMAEAALEAGVRPRAGLVVTRQGQGRPLPGLEGIEAAHPVPDGASLQAARRMLAMAKAAGEDDHILMLLSGGASALLCAPAEGLTLDAKQALTKALLRSGAPVDEINVVRRHLSAIKGGRLAAAAHPAKITTLAISDVVDDRPEAIGSGPTVADPAALADARAVLARYGVADPGLGWSESVKPGDPRLARCAYRVVASAALSLDAVQAAAHRAGYAPVRLGDQLQGEARDLGARHAAVARAHADRGGRLALISGGELTVTVRGDGRGGPNFEYAAALALGLEGFGGVASLSGDSDGIDGNCGAAGAFVFGDTADRASAASHRLDQALLDSDTASAFAAIGDVFAPGPTGTNVNDIRIILVGL